MRRRNYKNNKKTKKKSLPKRYTGTFIGTQNGYGFFTPDKSYNIDYDFFIPPRFVYDAIHNDTVEVELLSPFYSTDKKQEAKIVKIIERNLTEIVGQVDTIYHNKKKYKILTPTDKHIFFPIFINKESNCKVGDLVKCIFLEYPEYDNGYAALVETMENYGNADTPDANISSVLENNNIRTVFSEEILSEAEKVKETKITTKNRLDLRDKTIITIDSEYAKDLDDAISIEKTENGYILGVHIADVSEYVKENSILDKEAFERGTSIYFINKVIPMLPEAISNGCCSLNAGTDKYTLSAIITLDKKGKILDTDIKESVISSSMRGVYKEINDIYENDKDSLYFNKYKRVYSMFKNMEDLYIILKEKSIKRGAMEIESDEPSFALDEKGYPIEIIKSSRGISEEMIEQFMLCANEAVATWLYNKKMPCVYRVHDEPKVENFETFISLINNLNLSTSKSADELRLDKKEIQKILEKAKENGLDTVVSKGLLRSFAKANYSADNSPHFGLGIDKYCHFTSPIRRYPDLSVHRIIKKILRGEMNDEELAKMREFSINSANNSSENEIKAINTERKIDDIFKALYMSTQIGKHYKGIITTAISRGYFVQLDNTCEGLVELNNSRALDPITLIGKKINVIVDSVNISQGKIYFRRK